MGPVERAAIRRWIAPFNGTVRIEGVLTHPSEHGDGVEARIVSSRLGVVGHWGAQHRKQETSVREVTVQKGDVLDFHVGCRGNETSDSFEWPVKIELLATDQVAACLG